MSDLTDNAVSDALAFEALAWLSRLLSGAVTSEEAGAFKQWRGLSPAHDAAFADAVRLQRMVRRAVQARDAGAAVQARPPRGSARRDRGRIDPRRRALLVGGGAAAVAAASYAVVVRSDLLTGGLARFTSDYSTGVGEQRATMIAPGVSLELNTRTRVILLKSAKEAGVDLRSGEAVVSADRPGPFTILAERGRTVLNRGEVNIRSDSGGTCVTCLAGEAEVHYAGRSTRLNAGAEIRYGHQGLGATTKVDAAVVSAWREGLLIFRDTPLQHVVDELNRYRPGKIFLVGEALARRPVYGVFRINQIQVAIDQIRDLTGARQVDLPGGVVVLR